MIKSFFTIRYFIDFIFVVAYNVINDPLGKIGGINILNFIFWNGEFVIFALVAFISFITLLILRLDALQWFVMG